MAAVGELDEDGLGLAGAVGDEDLLVLFLVAGDDVVGDVEDAGNAAVVLLEFVDARAGMAGGLLES